MQRHRPGPKSFPDCDIVGRTRGRSAVTVLVLSAFFLPITAQGQAQGDPYARCLSLADTNGAIALGEAQSWARKGGGLGAEHCAALALIKLNRFAEGAGKLD